MKKSLASAALTLLISALSFTAQGALIQMSGNSFDDLGTSTLDLQTGLEWLDIKTDSRSQCSVYQDIGGAIPAGCTSFDSLDLFDDHAGWRYATSQEFTSLLSSWMGLTVSTNNSLTSLNSIKVKAFLALFSAMGNTSVQVDYAFDYPSNPTQAIGFYLSPSGLFINNRLQGNMNSAYSYAPLLVRQVPPAPVPETPPLALLLLGLAAMAIGRRAANKN